METTEIAKHCNYVDIVLTVPMRNGNSNRWRNNPNPKKRSYRTYEEWKLQQMKKQSKSEKTFLPYLWGMETLARTVVSAWIATVLTVPMRNGNENITGQNLRRWLSSYRTYEEWKLWYIRSNAWRLIRFLPYLWGMETRILFYYRLQYRVLTVPMRNGNLYHSE